MNVWCRLMKDCIIGPLFFSRKSTGYIFMDMLQEHVFPQTDNTECVTSVPVVFQLVGTLSHFSTWNLQWETFKLLDLKTWSVLWALQVPDLISFIICSYINKMICLGKINNVLKGLLLLQLLLCQTYSNEYEQKLGIAWKFSVTNGAQNEGY